MKKEQLKTVLARIWVPCLVALIGLLLVIDPDSATALTGKVAGGILVVIGVSRAVMAADKRSSLGPVDWVLAAAGIVAGVTLLKNPMLLAQWIGRIVGVMLAFRGFGDFRNSREQAAKLLGLGTLVLGVILIFVPLTLTRTLLRICGGVVMLLSILNITERLGKPRRIHHRSDIVDADE